MTSIVMANFKYRDPQTGKEFIVPTGWPCKDQQDAELTVKYYGMKTGALSAECKMEEVTNEESKQSATSITTAEAHQA
jgi:hypothetical protein